MGKARIKALNRMYHILGHGAFEITLFSDEDDKFYFLQLLVERSKFYNFVVHSFIIMDTHYHFSGFDADDKISTMMQSILTSYAMYYNKKYKRKGHVFMERFTSIPLDTKSYILEVTRYIHLNPHKIYEYKDKEESFKFSSYSKYIGNETDLNKFVDFTFIMELVNISDVCEFNKSYFEYTKSKSKLQL